MILRKEKRLVLYFVVATSLFFAGNFLLYWDDFANRGFWIGIGRLLASSLLFGSFMTIIQRYRNRKAANRNSAAAG
jgi:hypothetical protein